MASTPAIVADFRGLSDAEVYNYATVALAALAERLPALDSDAGVRVARARRLVKDAAESIEDPSYGHCDTCGALCDARGCVADRTHVAALEIGS